jgi:hypothetical protein
MPNSGGHRAIIAERLASHAALADERWETHRESHDQLARALAEYKARANEWRATLSDVRSSGLSRTEHAAEYRVMRTELEALVHALELRLVIVERLAQTAIDREKTARDLFGSIRSLLVVGFMVMGGLITLVLYLERTS